MKKLSLVLIGLMACLAIGVSTSRGQLGPILRYSLQDLGVVEDMVAAEPAAINSLGHVAGTAYKGQETCAFHYDYSKRVMEDAGGLNSRGFGISSTGMVVGDSVFITGPMPVSHAAMFKGGFAVDLGVMKGQMFSRANGINAMGQVVGYSGLQRDSTESKAFMWSGQTGMTDLGTLGGPYAQAYAINDGGFITGTAQKSVTTTHAFIYCPQCVGFGPMRDLGVLGGNSSYGMAINSSNHVAGYSTIQTNDPRVHAFLHDGNKMIDLGSLGGAQWGADLSVALGVNNLDQVVGYAYTAFGAMPIQQVAFLWTRNGGGTGAMVNLNTLLNETGKNYLLISATAINDNGQIVATAHDIRKGSVRAVLLTPGN
jgi:probable HAF family extracellular repeat protein